MSAGVIEGGWPFVIAAYAVTLTGLATLVVVVFWRAHAWAKRAAQLEQKK